MNRWITDLLMPMVAAVYQSQECVLQVTIYEDGASASLIPLEVFEGEDDYEDEED